MQRSIMKELLLWKEKPDRKPLIVKGVRQCGKTYILKKFGEDAFPDVAYFNFEETPALCSLFEPDFDTERILRDLGIFRNRTIKAGETLIIFDEIQSCPKALTALKYFCENAPEYFVACAGSLLGIAIHRNTSFPVGKVDFLTLYPMSFSEFLIASGNDGLSDWLTAWDGNTAISDLIGNRLSDLLKQYYFVGGMPEAVKKWCETKSIEDVEAVQDQILMSYELDFVKHAEPKEFPKLSAIWRSVPQQLAKPNSKFIFSQVKKGWRSKDLEDALEWLIGAGLIFKVCRIEKPFMPLASYADQSAFKVYLSDVGLLRRLAKLPAEVILNANGLYTEFKGAMTENYVLNELIKSVCSEAYYWTSGNSAEVDFVVQCRSRIVPIEVKSEKNVKARSLAEYGRKYQPTCAVITSLRNECGGNGVRNVPLYAIPALNRLPDPPVSSAR